VSLRKSFHMADEGVAEVKVEQISSQERLDALIIS